MNDEFVRKDVHDAQINALNQRIDDLEEAIHEISVLLANAGLL